MYSLVIPPELVGELYSIREKTGISIRKPGIRGSKVLLKEIQEN